VADISTTSETYI